MRDNKKGKEESTLVQCTNCGEINYINWYIPFSKDYIKLFCPKCKEYHMQLNLGQNEDDKYLYMDINIDQRYYRY